MSNYYEMRSAKVRIAHALMARGWKVYDYKADESDSMTDYYSPASWGGIATKNGYVLVVDVGNNGNSGKETIRYNRSGGLSADDRAKLAKLEEMREDRGATPEEADTARKMAEKLRSKVSTSGPTHDVVDIYPVFMANPGRSKWHIEKDGKIYDKGTALTKFANLPTEYMFDLDAETFKDQYAYRTQWGTNDRVKRELTEDEAKAVRDFKTLLQRLENVADGVAPMGDGTEETEQEGLAAQSRQGYEKIAVTETKTVRKPVKVDRTTIQEGDILTFSHHGGYWQVINAWTNSKGNCYTYEVLGSEKRGYQRLKNGKRYYQTEAQLKKVIAEGRCILHTMQDVTETHEVEKWVKIETKANNSPKTAAPKTEFTSDTENINNSEQSTLPYNITITADTDTRDNSPLWVVKIIDRLSRGDYIKVAEQLKALKGYYSKYKSGFIFRYDPTEALNGATTAPQHQESNNSTKTTHATEPTQQQVADQAQAETTALLERIEKGITALQDKVTSLSGDYQTNTYKRMQEQAGRENKIEGWETEIRILEYVKGKLADNLPITALDAGLTVGAFREEIRGYYLRKYGKYPQAIVYPLIDHKFPLDDWYNIEVPKKQKRLNKHGITNTAQLNAAVDAYKPIHESASRYINPVQQKIKTLMSQYKLQQRGDINFTPAQVAAEMIKLARIDHTSRVLEPSAGIGNIADEIKKVTEHVDVCERMHGFRELLTLKGYNLVGDDFMEYNRTGYYDAVIMNPPFSSNQDIIHLQHAYDLLKPDGVLVCITSPHWTFANDKTSQEFRLWLEQLDHFTQELPSGTFEMTGVRSKIVVIEKQAETMQEAI